ncbi:hypothetical protein GGR51DRAFT_221778 [Nemania sp. FL0031]|nr:hypothetical protein GGR51DRAFT_221778 [Nemania sp. FL0031]
MAVSPTSQCYQAARRHLRPHCDGIWVPESLLVSTFERYVATFRTGARHGSSVPGPMEHRKRMAKRQMGELHFGQSHSAAPIWELTSLVDLTQWKWSPPTSPAARSLQNMSATDMRGLSATVVNPFRLLFSQPAEAAEDPHKLDKILLPENVILSGVTEHPTLISWDVDTTPLDVIDTALEFLLHDISNVTGVSARFPIFCDSWQQALAEGRFRGQAVDTVLAGVLDRLDAKSASVGYAKAFGKLKLLLVEATINGMSSGGADQVASFDSVAWNSILRGASTIPMNTIRTFTKAITCIPDAYLISVSSGILENLNSFFKALGRATERPTLPRQASKMLVPLMNLGRPELRFILDDATQRLLEYAHADGVNFVNMRLGWLLFLARLPGIDTEYLAQACTALETGIAHSPLPAPEICRLFLAWSNNQTPLRRYTHLLNAVGHYTTDCYSTLADALWKTRQFYRAKNFGMFLDAIGRENAVTLLVRGVSHPRGGDPRMLANVALGIRKPRAAIDVLCLFEECRRRKKPFWKSSFGFKALEILTWVPDIDHSKILRLFRIDPSRRFGLRRRRRVKGLQQNVVARIVAVSIVMGFSPFITSRKGFRLMMKCYAKLAKHENTPPRSFLQALVHQITRPLLDGQPGITTRVQYILGIVRQHAGREEAGRIATAIERRRMFNFKPK